MRHSRHYSPRGNTDQALPVSVYLPQMPSISQTEDGQEVESSGIEGKQLTSSADGIVLANMAKSSIVKVSSSTSSTARLIFFADSRSLTSIMPTLLDRAAESGGNQPAVPISSGFDLLMSSTDTIVDACDVWRLVVGLAGPLSIANTSAKSSKGEASSTGRLFQIVSLMA